MARIIVSAFLNERSAAVGGQSFFPISCSGAANVVYNTIQADGTPGSATLAVGMIAPDTGDWYSSYGEMMEGEVVRTIREAWVQLAADYPVGTEIFLGTNGTLDDTGTVRVGKVLRTPYAVENDPANRSTQAYINFANVM